MHKNLIILIALMLLFPFDTVAKVRGTSKVDGLYSLKLSEQRDLLIQLPNSYHLNENLSYPVLYLTDGLRNFNHASGTLDLLAQSDEAQEMIIVAIKNTERTRDFTPTYDESYNQWGVSGGADNFLDFIEQELKPYIDKHYRTNNFNALSGHSLGGLLTIYALHTRPHLFQAFFAFSPSLWWHDETIFKNAEHFYKNTAELNRYVYINMANETGNMLNSFLKYKGLVQSYPIKGLNYNIDLIKDENHGTSAMVGHNQAIRHLYKTLQCKNNVTSRGLDAVAQCYSELSKTYNANMVPTYTSMAQAAGSAFNNKQFDKAIAIYQKITLKFPYLSDPHYRIAYIYHNQGDNHHALNEINKALKISVDENVENNKYKQFRAYILAGLKQSDQLSL